MPQIISLILTFLQFQKVAIGFVKDAGFQLFLAILRDGATYDGLSNSVVKLGSYQIQNFNLDLILSEDHNL